jgi:DNA-binding NtrC family response regulator
MTDRPTQSLEEKLLDVTNVDASSTGDESLTGAAASPMYLLVFEGESSRLHRLPQGGELTIGRGAGCELRINSSSASRQHAAISVDDRTAVVRDLGSQNGTIVNGERLMTPQPRELLSGDVISIGGCTMAFHNAPRTTGSSRMVGFGELRRRLDGEVDRALRYQRQFGVVCAHLGAPVTGTIARRSFEGKLSRVLRRIDAGCWAGDDALYALLPETEADETAAIAKRVIDGLAGLAGETRVGYAVFPGDGCAADELLAGARSAALTADVGAVAAAGGTVQTIEVAGRAVLVCDGAMARMYALIDRLAATELPVLIWGETGTGKELAANALHARSPRAERQFVALNCAAIHENLVESELFGHDKGAFTGAAAAKAGLFEAASGGTVFLDEIGELSLTNQAKLLRVLETHRITRVGEVKERPVDIRLVAATNRDLQEEVKQGRFRQDLYFRLSGAALWLPPLRDRPRELPVLAQMFLSEACERAGRPAMALSPEAMIALASHGWPGNVRELKNLMDYAAAAFAESVLQPWHLEDRLAGSELPVDDAADTPSQRLRMPLRAPAEPTLAAPKEFRSLAEEIEELERARIAQALEAAGGNQTQAARLIHMPLRTFMNKLKRHGLSGAQVRKSE